jgi:hypothetical protein
MIMMCVAVGCALTGMSFNYQVSKIRYIHASSVPENVEFSLSIAVKRRKADDEKQSEDKLRRKSFRASV